MSRRFFKSLTLIFILIGWIGFLSTPSKLDGDTEIALAATDPVIAVAGNIACDPIHSGFNGGNGTATTCRQKYTSDLLVNQNLAAVLTLGDNQYECGGFQAFMQSYDLSWGRVKSITRPSLGNHDYKTSGNGTGCTSANAGADGNFDYFGAAAGTRGQGYYSFDIGAWHLIALNTNCSEAGGCSNSSPQGQWLRNDLATHTNMCTLAYFHHPLFSSGIYESSASRPFWQLLYQYNAELILSGHDHIYERFAPQKPDGTADPVGGIRQFTLGTGGRSHHSITGVASNSEVRNNTTFGVLKLTLHPTSYDWQFVPEAGGTFTDSGSRACNTPITSTRTPTKTPTPPVGTSPTRTPTATAPSAPTASRTPTPTNTAGSSDVIFADGFETGNLSAWTGSSIDGGNLSVNPSAALVGSQGLQAVINDANAMYVSDDHPNAEPRYRVRFYFDPNSLTMADADDHVIFRGISGTTTVVVRVEFGFSAGGYQIRAGLVSDGSAWTDSNWFPINGNAAHSIELDWRAATGAAANNGGLTLWIDGAQQADLTGIDNDTRRIDRARIGALASIDAGTSGTYYFDAFESRRQGYIGP